MLVPLQIGVVAKAVFFYVICRRCILVDSMSLRFSSHWLFSLSVVALLLVGCKQDSPSAKRQIIMVEAKLPPRPLKPDLPPLFLDIERRTFQFFGTRRMR